MSIRRTIMVLAGAAVLALSGCTSDSSGDEVQTSEQSSASTTSSTTAASTVASSSLINTPEMTSDEPVPEPVEQQASPSPQPASPTVTYMDPGAQYWEVCYSGTADQWANYVNPATGCGATLNPNYIEPAPKPYIVECLFGTPGPSLMSDGTMQNTDYCWETMGGPEYAKEESDATTNFWKCMEAGGTEETCRQ